MRRGIYAVAVLAALGCGGGVQKQLHGVTFSLSSKEAGLAADYERNAPREADAQTRCEYWGKRKEDARQSHLIGVFSYSPEYFQHLHAWAEAEESDACGAAKATEDAAAAKQNEADRLRALAEARMAHETRDRQGWSAAHPADCAAAAREDACNGVRAYLQAVPDGAHAAEANAALEAAAPRLGELRRAREEAEGARLAAIAKQEEAAGFRVSNLRAMLDDAPAGSRAGQSVKLAFDLTVLRALPRGVGPIVRAACQVGDKRRVDVDAGLDARLNELSGGDTKEIDANAYAKTPLEAPPSRCELAVMKGMAAETAGPLVHTFCYVPGQGVRDGACGP